MKRCHDDVELLHCVNQVIRPDVGINECIILCNFRGRIMSGFEV